MGAGGQTAWRLGRPTDQAAMNLRFTIYDLRFESSPCSLWCRSASCRDGRPRASHRGYLMIEALVYIGLVFVLLGVAYDGLYRFIDNTVVLSRNADDVSRAVHAGERWRTDVRSATLGIRIETNATAQVLYCVTPQGEIGYTAHDSAVFRRVGAGPWVRFLNRVNGSTMMADVQPNVIGWRWELELSPQTKGTIREGRVRPLFTFLAIPRQS